MATKTITLIALAAALCLAVSGCGKKAYAPLPPPPPPPDAIRPMPSEPPARVAINSFTAEPSRIEKGQATTLRWSISNATDMSIDPILGAVQSQGSRQVFPSTSTTYTLTARGPGGTDSRSVTVEVSIGSPPPTSGRPPASPLGETIRLVVRLSPDVAKAVGRRTPLDEDLARLRDGAYLFDPPTSVGPDPRTVRLFIDVNPRFVSTDEEERRALMEPGFVQGIKTKISDSMRAVLSGIGVKIDRLYPNPSSDEQRMSAAQPAQWIWSVKAAEGGMPQLILDLQALLPGGQGKWVSVRPPITHAYGERAPPQTTEPPAVPTPGTPVPGAPVESHRAPAGRTGVPIPFAPGSSWPKVFLIGALLVLAAVLAALLTPAFRKRLGAILPARQKAGAPLAGSALMTQVLVIHGKNERAAAEKFCKGLGALRCEFLYALAGFAAGSPEWQRHFSGEHKRADAVLVLLTGTALGEEWINWQIAQVSGGSHRVPVYPVILDERVSLAASSLNRLADLPSFNGSKREDLTEVSAILNAMAPSSVRAVRCFLSYSRNDGVKLADQLLKDLEAHGIRCWRDSVDIPAGTPWEKQIELAIEGSTHILFLITAKSRESPNVDEEVLCAQQKGKVMIPLLSDDGRLPFGLQRIQGIPLFPHYEAGLARLVRDITAPGAEARHSVA